MHASRQAIDNCRLGLAIDNMYEFASLSNRREKQTNLNASYGIYRTVNALNKQFPFLGHNQSDNSLFRNQSKDIIST